jgi:Na+-transporting methylmalonyl-CoA/oxaloacetate decarboxylase gamma subunit
VAGAAGEVKWRFFFVLVGCVFSFLVILPLVVRCRNMCCENWEMSSHSRKEELDL